MFRRVLCCIGIAVLGLSYARTMGQEQAQPPKMPAIAEPQRTAAGNPHAAPLEQYCATCHNEKARVADVVLTSVSLDNPAGDAALWERVIRKLRAREMPPAGRPRPSEEFYDSFVAYLETALDRAAEGRPEPGRPAVHRLNRTEYANAVRDLFGIEIDAASLLPTDDAGRSFDNIADILSVSPLLVEKYLSAARKVSLIAVGEPEVKPYVAQYDVSRRVVQEWRAGDDLPFGSRGGLAVRHHFPLDGEYVIKVRLQRNNDNYIRGLGEPHQLDVRVDGARLKLFTVGGEHKGRSSPVYSFINKDYRGDSEQETYETLDADGGLEVRFPAKAGTRLVAVAFLKDPYAPEGVLMPRQHYDELLAYKGGEPAVDSVFISGPHDPRGLTTTRSRERIFVCRPAAGAAAAAEQACARRIASTLARRAYRRPIGEREVEGLLKFYALGRKDGDFEAGIRTVVQGVLTSPEFLFRVERDPAGARPGTPYRIPAVELASRLSFFLWSSLPDDPLLTDAERGRLLDAEVLDRQVRRMMADPRSRALSKNFTEQWLGLRKLAHVSPDPQIFPDFDDNLREAFQKESVLLAGHIAREDRSVLDFLDADYTFLNERLARHYGVLNVYGGHFRRVALDDRSRGGILGHGGVLTVTSYGNRTAPTLRGKWVLDNLLGTPPPPPPPDVPALKEVGTGGEPLSMRQRMEEHRVNPTCASCHSRMDPLGFALENFDAIGRWRTADGGTPVDASGLLPDGTRFSGPAELRKILLARREQFVSTLTEKLMAYALGREVEHSDQPAIRKIVRAAAPGGYRWSSLVTGIVRSTPFQMRMTTEP